MAGANTATSPTVSADAKFASGDEKGAFDVLLDALMVASDDDDREKFRRALVGLFPIAADLFLAGGDGAEEFLELRLCVASVQLCVLLAHVQIRRIDEALFI